MLLLKFPLWSFSCDSAVSPSSIWGRSKAGPLLYQSLGWEDPLEEGMATHSSIPTWRIPWTEKPGRLQSMWFQKKRSNHWFQISHNLATLRMRWPKYQSFSFSIIPSEEHPGLISYRMDWLDLLVLRGSQAPRRAVCA